MDHAAAAQVEKNVVCSSCDGMCPVVARVADGRVVQVHARDNPFLKNVICVKGVYAHKSFAHPDRLLYPLKRQGARGGGEWRRVTWDEALDDIAGRLQGVIGRHGPEALAVATSNWNTTVDSGMCRRFMNLIGSPNFVSGVAYCMGNTSAVNRMVYGWYPRADTVNSNCIVLFGHNPLRHSWTLEYKTIRLAQARGAKLIMLDPRKSENAEAADIWLPLRAGTDAAMCFGWLNVILDEELYDKAFVRSWTHGFDAFVDRVREYPVDRVAAITGVAPELIVAAARMYATSGPAVIPWSPITDQQVSSTSAIRLHCALRALTGNLDIKGGELLTPLNPTVIPDTDLELHDRLAETQRAKQLGADRYPVFTYRGMAPLAEPTERVWGRRWANLIGGNYMASPTAVFRAMATAEPYPVKALFSLGNNTLMAYANMRQIYAGIMRQDLVVVHDHMMTPTAQLADYVLPGDAWLERPSMMAGVSEQAMEPPGECRSVYAFWRGLASRMGLAEYFPWESLEDLFDHRLSPSGLRWSDVVASGKLPLPPATERKYAATGFATPTGKVELHSTVLESLGFDPLPYYREARRPDQRFPLTLFVGVRDNEYFHSGQRHVPELRQRCPDPFLFLHPSDAQTLGLARGDWAAAETANGRVFLRTEIRDDMPEGLVRVPHGWWRPESEQGGDVLSGVGDFADAQLNDDADEELMDREQGVPHLKGIPCRVRKSTPGERDMLSARYGPSAELPRGPRGRVVPLREAERDFMYDSAIGVGVEFDAAELARYGKGSFG